MNAKGFVIATAAAALFISGAVKARAAEQAGGKEVSCAGVNECKGHGSCAGGSGGNACAGQNACKGKGVVKMSEADCKAKGGKVVEAKH